MAMQIACHMAALGIRIAGLLRMSDFFAIITDSGNAVAVNLIKAGQAERTVLLFTSKVKAKTFIRSSPSEPMRPEHITAGTVNHWISNMRLAGARFAAIDPPPEGVAGASRVPLDVVRALILQNFPPQKPGPND
jgi:hypothetical protein